MASEGKVHLTEIRVGAGDVDFTGHVFHPRYLEMFCNGRSEMLRQIGFELFPPGHTRAGGKGKPLAFPFCTTEVFCRIFSSSMFNDVLTLQTFSGEIRKRSAKIEHRLFEKGSDKMVASGYAIYVFGDKERFDQFKSLEGLTAIPASC